jgi:hypothetical protein
MAEETKQAETKTEEVPQEPVNADIQGMVSQFEATLDEYMVKKAPFHIPANGKEFLVKVSPYVVLVFALLTVPVIIAGLGLTALLSPFAMMGGYYHFGVLGLISGLLSLVALVVELTAVKGLFNRTHAAWRLMYYASLIAFASNIISFNIVGGIIGSVIGWYILFQVKALYKN